jgi:hypothetical protein
MLQVQSPSPSRSTRAPSPERWQYAAERALAEGIEVRQVNASGMWVANSGTHADVAYVLEIAGGFVQSCSCPAGSFGDPCCKHAAQFYLDAGVLDVDEPEMPSPAPGLTCFRCAGAGKIEEFGSGWNVIDVRPCPVCGGSGQLPAVPLHDHPITTVAA